MGGRAIRLRPRALPRQHRLRRPPAAERLVQIDERALAVAQRDDAIALGRQQAALRIEYLELAGVAALVADFDCAFGIRVGSYDVKSAQAISYWQVAQRP